MKWITRFCPQTNWEFCCLKKTGRKFIPFFCPTVVTENLSHISKLLCQCWWWSWQCYQSLLCFGHLNYTFCDKTCRFIAANVEALMMIITSLRAAATICPAPCSWPDLLTLKVVSESRVTWATSVPILVFLGLSVLDSMYATDRRQTHVIA